MLLLCVSFFSFFLSRCCMCLLRAWPKYKCTTQRVFYRDRERVWERRDDEPLTHSAANFRSSSTSPPPWYQCHLTFFSKSCITSYRNHTLNSNTTNMEPFKPQKKTQKKKGLRSIKSLRACKKKKTLRAASTERQQLL